MRLKNFAKLFVDSSNHAIKLRWNWGTVLLFVLVWSYGFENVVYPDSPIKTLLVLVFVILVIAVINQTSNANRELFQEECSFTKFDILTLFAYITIFVALTLFATYGLNISLVGDHLYHAQNSQNQSMEIAGRLIDKFNIPENIEYKTIVRTVSIAILAIMIFIITYIRKYRLKDRTTLIILLFLFLKLGHIYTDVHPPLRLFPLWLSSVFFGLNDFSFRFVSLLALSVLALGIYKFSQAHFGKLNAFLMGLSIGSIPLLLHIGSIVEQSIWTVLSWTFVLISISESKQNPNYVRWFSVVAIASLMRAPDFIALVPIFTLIVFELIKSKELSDIKKYLRYATPVLVLIPFLWIELSQGTPAISGEETTIVKIISSLADGFSIKAMYYNIGLPWVLFLLFILLPINMSWPKAIAYIGFFVSAYFVFYSIRPILWGVPRYQAELWLPFIILGFYKLALIINKQQVMGRFLPFALVLLILFNIFTFNHLNRSNPSIDSVIEYYQEVKTGNVRIWSEGVYNIGNALRAAAKAGYSSNTCKVGITYGTFSEVMNGFTIAEIQAARDNFPDCSSWGPLNIARINSNQNIKLILFIDKSNKQNEINSLLKSGQWLLWNTFHNEQYGSTIIGLVRQ